MSCKAVSCSASWLSPLRFTVASTVMPSGRSFQHTSFIKAAQPCLAGQHRAGPTKAALRPDNLNPSEPHRASGLWSDSTPVVENGNHSARFLAKPYVRTPYIRPSQDHKNNLRNIALWSALPLLPCNLC